MPKTIPISVSDFDFVLELKEIRVEFPGVLALDGVNFNLKPGETHILFGENGAGKSTLSSVISGVIRSYSGEIYFRQKPIYIHSVHHARSLGINAVFQEFSLVDSLTVEENLFLGAEPCNGIMLDKKGLRKKAEELLSRVGFSIDPQRKVESLSRGEQQMIEIAKAFRSDLSVLLLDEPTASLTNQEAKNLFQLMKMAKEQKIGLIYITHRMSEIPLLGDRVTVLRDGKYVATVNAKETSEEKLIRLMTGRVFNSIYPQLPDSPKKELLTVQNLSLEGGTVKNVSFSVKSGEIVGFAGLVGSGKSEVARACFGLEKPAEGKVIFDGEEVTGFSVKKMLKRGFFYNSRDRRKEGLVMVRNCRENITLSSLSEKEFTEKSFLKLKNEKKIVNKLSEKFCLEPLNPERDVQFFSGGNQQKVLLAKSLTHSVKLYVFDEPTVGVDIGTRIEIYKFIADLAVSGAAIVLISSDLAEVLYLSNRIYVMYGGKICAEIPQEEISEESVLKHFFEKTIEIAS